MDKFKECVNQEKSMKNKGEESERLQGNLDTLHSGNLPFRLTWLTSLNSAELYY